MRGPHQVMVDDVGVAVGITPFEGVADYFCLSPGLVDLQMNGYAGVDVASATKEDLSHLDSVLATAGTTSWLGTIVTAPLHVLSGIVAGLQQSHDSGNIQGFIGVHIEGPFLGSAPGAHRVNDIVEIDLDWISQLPGAVRLMTVAPEQTEAIEGIRQLISQGIVVALGHSQPNSTQYADAIAAGASMVTHLFNAMSGVHHRDFGMALRALIDDRIHIGLIADLVHVQPDAVSLAFRAKDGSKICLVSDTVGWQSPGMRRLNLQATDAIRLTNGTLAGSCTPLAQCVRNVVQTCGVSLELALRAATSTPSDVIGSSTTGRIRLGAACDIVAWDTSLTVVDTWRRLPSVGA